MANFRVHLVGAAAAGGLGAAASLAWLHRADTACAAFVAGTLGGLLPDVDHDHAVPCRELFSLLAVMIPVVLVPVLTLHGLTREWTIPLVAAGYVLIRFGVAEVFKRVTVHRGVFHSVPFILCAGAVAVLMLRTLPMSHRLILGGTVTLGALAHLVLDEVYAVDFTGKRMKKSFGTALKFWAPSKAAAVACYVALGLLTGLVLRDVRRAARPAVAAVPTRDVSVVPPVSR